MYCDGYYGMSGFGVFGGFWGLWMLAVQAFLAILFIFLFYRLGKKLWTGRSIIFNPHLDTLRERYALGEIDEEEYIRMNKVLTEK
jgi:uncharacterized membrane protein